MCEHGFQSIGRFSDDLCSNNPTVKVKRRRSRYLIVRRWRPSEIPARKFAFMTPKTNTETLLDNNGTRRFYPMPDFDSDEEEIIASYKAVLSFPKLITAEDVDPIFKYMRGQLPNELRERWNEELNAMQNHLTKL